MNRPTKLLIVALALIAAAAFAPTAALKVAAMPTFAQAYGYDCKVCHTQVPSLNTYGRYVQRTMYAGLDPEGYKKEIPIWGGESVNYSTGQSPYWQVGNLAFHAVGVYNDVTFHVQQWVTQANNLGDLDTAWVSWNPHNANLHVVYGKMPGPGPSFFSQWSDVAPFAPPQMAIGEHTQALSSNRWGGALNYGDQRWYAFAGYYGSGAGLGGATQWTATPENGIDKGFQWTAAYQPSNKPVSAGFVGNTGTVPLAGGGIDHYWAVASYVQADPTPRLPGLIAYYQIGYDGNPVETGVGARSTGYSAEVYAPFLAHWESNIGLRAEMTNDGMGNVIHTGEIDLGFRIMKYIHADFEAGLANGATPVWSGYVWWTQPFGKW